MSKDSKNYVNGVYIEPAGDRPKGSGYCALSVALIFVGIVTIILGFVSADVIYIVGGVLSGMLNFALAVIVDACQKYRHSSRD